MFSYEVYIRWPCILHLLSVSLIHHNLWDMHDAAQFSACSLRNIPLFQITMQQIAILKRHAAPNPTRYESNQGTKDKAHGSITVSEVLPAVILMEKQSPRHMMHHFSLICMSCRKAHINALFTSSHVLFYITWGKPSLLVIKSLRQPICYTCAFQYFIY